MLCTRLYSFVLVCYVIVNNNLSIYRGLNAFSLLTFIQASLFTSISHFFGTLQVSLYDNLEFHNRG